MTGFEVLTMGRVSVDLYPEQVGVALPDVTSFGKFLGGSATNVAVAAARLGRRSAVITKVGDDPFGTYVRRALEGFGVDPRFVGTDPRLRTPIAFCEIFPPDDFPLLFYREPKAPDLELRADELDTDAVAAAGVFWTTGTGLSQEPSRGATIAALAARAGTHPSRGISVHDLDHRPMLWDSDEEAGRWAREALGHATVAVGNSDEVAIAVGRSDPVEAAGALLETGVRLAVVKRGPHGVLARTAEGMWEVPPVDVEVVNGLGAGDAFGGALCHGLLAGWDPGRIIAYANAAGAIVASRLACADAMPTAEEVDALLERAPATGRR
ncbi:5-dehydro-2-deoxygluconokinase [soil metagenome]